METEVKPESLLPSPSRGFRRRWIVELVVVLVLGGALGGMYLWSAHRHKDLGRGCDARLAAARQAAEASLDRFAHDRAEAVFRAYGAGIHAAVLASRQESLEVSVAELVRLPGVVAVHLLGQDGSVITSSDRKLQVTGRVGERAAWALRVKELSQRAGDVAGTTELATPIQDAAGVKAILWMAYDTEQIKAQARGRGGVL